MAKRAIIIVLDSVGIGEMPDADKYGDVGSNTLKNTSWAAGGLKIPNLEAMGIGNLAELKGVAPRKDAIGSYGVMAEKSPGKDTTCGHWEMVGSVLDKPFPTYPNGFPPEVIAEFEKRIGRRVLGNKVASGTEIIKELGPEHIKTGFPIVYTSADSVFQIAAHEEVIPLPDLYRMCKTARKILDGEHRVGRVIARPFIGKPGDFVRTSNRHDYAVKPDTNILTHILQAGQQVIGVGKIKDIFAGEGISESFPTKNNQDGINRIMDLLPKVFTGLLFANLVDFDQLYGHRNDPQGYARALEEFDEGLAEILKLCRPEDMLFITADHGCDPTTASTDHSREYVPLLVYGPQLKPGVALGTRQSFADLGKTVAEHLEVAAENLPGESFYSQVRC